MKTTNNQHTQMQCNSNSYNPKHGEFLQSWRRFPSVKSAQTVNWSTSVLKVLSSKTVSLKPSLNCQFCSRSELAGGEYWPWRPAERRRLGWPPEEDPSGHRQELHCCTHYTSIQPRCQGRLKNGLVMVDIGPCVRVKARAWYLAVVSKQLNMPWPFAQCCDQQALLELFMAARRFDFWAWWHPGASSWVAAALRLASMGSWHR